MKYLTFIVRRYFLTAVCKLAAVIAGKVKKYWSFEFLRKSLYKRDLVLCCEAKFCMNKVVKWQSKAQKCILAHHEYEKELKKEAKNESVSGREDIGAEELQEEVSEGGEDTEKERPQHI